ncbi:MAG: LCP family protein, partial [Oscillospiraceae bacterium]|nr:LCP family protein [Oscillospiraceae bacterium]
LFSLAAVLAACGGQRDAAGAGDRARAVEVARELEEEEPQAAPARKRLPYCYVILVSGVDDAGGGSDTNLLVRFDAPNKRVDLVSLPRDTLLHTARHSNKLNYAYASGGTERLRSDVEDLLGVPVDFCVSVGLDGFAALVDAIGGVEFDVPADMDYDDPAQGLHIHFAKGLRRLNGEEAMEVVRWRKNNDGGGYADADVGRIATQQAFLRAVAEQAMRIGNAPALAQALFSHVKTDFSAGNLVWLAAGAMDIDAEDVRFHTLPGDGAGYYRGESVYVLDPEATLALVNDALNPYDQPITMDELDILVP